MDRRLGLAVSDVSAKGSNLPNIFVSFPSDAFGLSESSERLFYSTSSLHGGAAVVWGSAL